MSSYTIPKASRFFGTPHISVAFSLSYCRHSESGSCSLLWGRLRLEERSVRTNFKADTLLEVSWERLVRGFLWKWDLRKKLRGYERIQLLSLFAHRPDEPRCRSFGNWRRTSRRRQLGLSSVPAHGLTRQRTISCLKGASINWHWYH